MARTPEEERAISRERVRAFRMKAKMTPEERAQVEAAEAEVRAEKRRLHLEREKERVRKWRERKVAEAEAVKNPPLPEPAPHVERRGRGRPRLTEEQRAARAVSRPAPRSVPLLDVPTTPEAPEAPRRSPVTEEEEREAAAQVCAIARFRYFARHLWAVACPDAPNPAWMPHMDVICDEIQEVIEESDRRRLLAARIAEECAGDPELHAELIEAELGNLPMLRLILLVPPRGSKPVWEEEPVTERTKGRIRLADVRVGDEVLTHRGRFRRVLAVHEQGVLPLLRVETGCGRRVRTAPDHPFLTTRGWVEAQDMVPGDVVAAVVPQEPCGTETMSNEEARLLGYLIGDGTCYTTNPQFTNEDPGVIEDVVACAGALGFYARIVATSPSRAGTTVTRILLRSGEVRWKRTGEPPPLRVWMESRGLAGKGSYNKRVPSQIMAATPEIIAEFLGAYWSCDGFIASRGKARSGGDRPDRVIGCDTVSEGLARDMQHILLRLGIKSRVRRKVSKIRTAKQGSEYVSWCTVISDTDNAAKFIQRVPLRHAKKANGDGTRRTEFERLLIEDDVVAVVPYGEGVCRCLTVEEDESFTAGDLAVHNSKLVECLFPAWRWLHRPQDTILALSSSGKLTEKHGVYLRDVLRSPAYLQLQRRQIARGRFRRDPKLKGDYAGGAFGMRGDEDAKGLFSNTLGGGRSGYALGAKYTGADADITIIDDPHDVDDAMQGSAESQARAIGEVVDSYRTKVQDRSNNKLWAPIILIMQRVHPNDLAHYMIAQPGARVVCLPAEYDPDHEHVYAKDWRTRRGELLDGVRLPRSVLDFMRADDPFAYATKYGMRPTVKEGVRYRREWFDNTFDEDPRVLARSGWYEEVLISVDAANKTGARNDLTSMGVWGRRGLDRDLLDRRSFRAEITGLESEFRQLCAAWPMALIKLVEDKANGTALIQAVKVAKYGPGGGMVPPIAGVVPVQPRGDKKTRSAAFAEPVAAERRIRLPARAPWRSEYVENMVGFGAGGQHDDDVDMTSQAMQRWAEIVVPWLDPARRERIARPAVVVTRGELLTRWDRRSSERLASYHMGVVPGWAMGQMRGEAVAVVCDRRGRMVSLVEATEGGVAGFIAAAAVEARYWSAEVVYAEPRDRGSPAMQVAAGLIAAGARVAGRAACAGEGGRRPGEKGAGWGGSPSELSAVWNAFLGLMAEDLVGIPDGATLEAIETVVETEGLPAMADGSPLGGRLLALLLALRGVAETHARVAGSQVVRFEPSRPEAVDLWSLGVR